MLRNTSRHIWMIILFMIINNISKSAGLCSDNETDHGESVLLITFGSGAALSSEKTPADFNFSTTYETVLSFPTKNGAFCIVNAVLTMFQNWHRGAIDHTLDDVGGYMYFVVIGPKDSQFFNSVVNDLSIGVRYKFSAYLANTVKNESNLVKPNIRFEVRTATIENELLEQSTTDDIPAYDTLTWSKYGLAFLAPSSSVVLLMISNGQRDMVTSLVVDDIELRACPTIHSDSSTPDEITSTNFIETTTQTETKTFTSTERQLTTIFETSTINQICFPPEIKLIPEALLSSPLQYRRSQDFFILTTIKLNCNTSLLTTKNWLITNSTNEISVDKTINLNLSELYIPSNILPYGIYELKLTVTMIEYPSLSSSASVYVQIIPTDIQVNLIQLGTSMITIGYRQDLQLNPGNYSIDPDENQFNASDWIYKYYCRIYHSRSIPYEFISDMYLINTSCLFNQSEQRWKYNGVKDSLESSLIIFGNSLQVNTTYQFLVQMENRRNSSIRANGYVFVQIESLNRSMIVIGCVISTLCSPNREYQFINPTTQIALVSRCTDHCENIQKIQWNIYHRKMKFTDWILFNQTDLYENSCFFGINTSHFTATTKLFLSNPEETHWRFEVGYTIDNETSFSSVDFLMNQSPDNGSCEVNPSNGTTNTIFTISCPNWFDEDLIKDYSLYYWTNDRAKQTIIAFSPISEFQVRLPFGNSNLIVHIRDTLNCIREYNISSPINIQSDLVETIDIINILNSLNKDPLIQLLASGNQNLIGQIVTLLAYELDRIHKEMIKKAASGGIPVASISISPLGSPILQQNSIPFNESALFEFNKKLNPLANLQEVLINFITNLTIVSINSIKLQSLMLTQLTQATNQLTRTALRTAVKAIDRLARHLHSMSNRIPYEDVQIAATQLIQSASNILTAVNGPLQQRTNVLDLDFSRANEHSNDNDIHFDSDLLITKSRSSRNIYYQKQLANDITHQMTEIISLLTSDLNLHLNLGQDLAIDTAQVFFSLETLLIRSLSNKTMKQIGHVQIHIPSIFNENQMILLRALMKPLASFANSQTNTNLSTSISLSILDRNETDIPIQINPNKPIEIIIPRDPNILIPPMILQNVTNHNESSHLKIIDIKQLQPNENLTISIHFQVQPLNRNLSYLFIYQFDHVLNFNQFDGWSITCPSNLTNDDLYTYYINNQQTSGHETIIFGFREFNSTEMLDYCSANSVLKDFPVINKDASFTFNYKMRIYASGCYYLDKHNNWQSDGILVGSKTNLNQTQCFTTHLK